MKILRVITRLNIGGPARQAIDLNRELIKRGHEVKLVTGPCPEHEGGTTMEQEALTTFSCSNFGYIFSLQREISLKKDIYAFTALRKVIKNFKPDIVHTHMSKAGFFGRLAALAVRPRPKLVHTFHGHTFHSYFGRVKSWVFLQIERWLAKKTDTIVTISETQFNEIVDRYKIRAKRAIVKILLGFDLSEFLEIPEFEYINGTHLKIGIVGRVVSVKNHKLFIDFLHQMSDSFCISGFILGDGEGTERLVNYATERGVSLFVVGWKEPEKMSYWYKELDIVVCTSKNEGTPVSLIEAMAAGRLVVSTPVGGVPDLIGKNRGVLIIDEEDLSSTVLTIKQILESGEYKQIIRNAREYVRKQHILSKLVDNMENLYKLEETYE